MAGSTYAAEQLVLQVEGDITLLLDHAKDLIVKNRLIFITFIQTFTFDPSHLDGLSSDLYNQLELVMIKQTRDEPGEISRGKM